MLYYALYGTDLEVLQKTLKLRPNAKNVLFECRYYTSNHPFKRDAKCHHKMTSPFHKMAHSSITGAARHTSYTQQMITGGGDCWKQYKNITMFVSILFFLNIQAK